MSRLRAAWTFVVGPPAPAEIPARVRAAIALRQAHSEIAVGAVQVGAIVTFAALYAVAPKAFPPDTMFEPVPLALGIYALFTALRLWLAFRRRLDPFILVASVIIDMAVLMVTIWSFALQYQQEPAFYLKAPTLLYVFIIITLRTLRFEAGYVILAGVTAALGWMALLLYAIVQHPGPGSPITHDYVAYMTSSMILIGAEFDKIASILMVTAILAIAIVRARRVMIRAFVEGASAVELARFVAPEVASRARRSDFGITAGDAEVRDAAAMFVDLRGFTSLAMRLAPRELMGLLADYQVRAVPAIQRNGGTIDKFLGDGILASFGATMPSDTYAADALRATEDILEAGRAWSLARVQAGLAAPTIGVGIASGPILFGAIGDMDRLEYTVLGDTVNTAAKLEKHTKAEGVAAIASAATYDLALTQGFVPRHETLRRIDRQVAGIGDPIDLVAFEV